MGVIVLNKRYTTKEIADAVGVHVNTVRFYEAIGFLTKPERQKNGYRIYTSLHLDQCRLIRVAMKAEVLQNELRKKAIEIVTHCATLDFDAAITATTEYKYMIHSEIRNARTAIAAVERLLKKVSVIDNYAPMTRLEAANKLGVTSETLRTWERSGLIKIKRKQNGYRIYSASDIDRLNIIHTLRLANYSLSAILRLLNELDRHDVDSVETILNTPQENEDIVSVCDRLIVSLQNVAVDAERLDEMIRQMKKNYLPLQ